MVTGTLKNTKTSGYFWSSSVMRHMLRWLSDHGIKCMDRYERDVPDVARLGVVELLGQAHRQNQCTIRQARTKTRWDAKGIRRGAVEQFIGSSQTTGNFLLFDSNYDRHP